MVKKCAWEFNRFAHSNSGFLLQQGSWIRMLKHLCISLILLFLSGCTAMKYSQHTKITYVPPIEQDNLLKSKTYNTTYDKAWKAAVGVFAINNFQIKTMDKNSGIIAAESFLNPSDMMQIVIPGKTIISEFETEEKIVPTSYYRSADIEYVREHGRIAESKTYKIKEQKMDSKYNVTAFLNIFITQEKNKVRININTKYQTDERIGGSIPKPISTGLLEKNVITYLNTQLSNG